MHQFKFYIFLALIILQYQISIIFSQNTTVEDEDLLIWNEVKDIKWNTPFPYRLVRATCARNSTLNTIPILAIPGHNEEFTYYNSFAYFLLSIPCPSNDGDDKGDRRCCRNAADPLSNFDLFVLNTNKISSAYVPSNLFSVILQAEIALDNIAAFYKPQYADKRHKIPILLLGHSMGGVANTLLTAHIHERKPYQIPFSLLMASPINNGIFPITFSWLSVYKHLQYMYAKLNKRIITNSNNQIDETMMTKELTYIISFTGGTYDVDVPSALTLVEKIVSFYARDYYTQSLAMVPIKTTHYNIFENKHLMQGVWVPFLTSLEPYLRRSQEFPKQNSQANQLIDSMIQNEIVAFFSKTLQSISVLMNDSFDIKINANLFNLDDKQKICLSKYKYTTLYQNPAFGDKLDEVIIPVPNVESIYPFIDILVTVWNLKNRVGIQTSSNSELQRLPLDCFTNQLAASTHQICIGVLRIKLSDIKFNHSTNEIPFTTYTSLIQSLHIQGGSVDAISVQMIPYPGVFSFLKNRQIHVKKHRSVISSSEKISFTQPSLHHGCEPFVLQLILQPLRNTLHVLDYILHYFMYSAMDSSQNVAPQNMLPTIFAITPDEKQLFYSTFQHCSAHTDSLDQAIPNIFACSSKLEVEMSPIFMKNYSYLPIFVVLPVLPVNHLSTLASASPDDNILLPHLEYEANISGTLNAIFSNTIRLIPLWFLSLNFTLLAFAFIRFCKCYQPQEDWRSLHAFVKRHSKKRSEKLVKLILDFRDIGTYMLLLQPQSPFFKCTNLNKMQILRMLKSWLLISPYLLFLAIIPLITHSIIGVRLFEKGFFGSDKFIYEDGTLLDPQSDIWKYMPLSLFFCCISIMLHVLVCSLLPILSYAFNLFIDSAKQCLCKAKKVQVSAVQEENLSSSIIDITKPNSQNFFDIAKKDDSSLYSKSTAFFPELDELSNLYNSQSSDYNVKDTQQIEAKDAPPAQNMIKPLIKNFSILNLFLTTLTPVLCWFYFCVPSLFCFFFTCHLLCKIVSIVSQLMTMEKIDNFDMQDLDHSAFGIHSYGNEYENSLHNKCSCFSKFSIGTKILCNSTPRCENSCNHLTITRFMQNIVFFTKITFLFLLSYFFISIAGILNVLEVGHATLSIVRTGLPVFFIRIFALPLGGFDIFNLRAWPSAYKRILLTTVFDNFIYWILPAVLYTQLLFILLRIQSGLNAACHINLEFAEKLNLASAAFQQTNLCGRMKALNRDDLCIFPFLNRLQNKKSYAIVIIALLCSIYTALCIRYLLYRIYIPLQLFGWAFLVWLYI